jgi:hypothetical protein
MNYDTKYYRKANDISMTLPVGYKHIWENRIPKIKSMMIKRITVKDIAKHFKCSVGSLTEAMRYHGVSAIRVRHDHKMSQLKLNVK